jgi:hypothetical protein
MSALGAKADMTVALRQGYRHVTLSKSLWRKHMKATFILVGLLGTLAMPLIASAQGVIGGAQQGASQGAREGGRAAGPVGGAVGTVVGGTVGGVTGGVKGALGVSDRPKRKPKKQTNN